MIKKCHPKKTIEKVRYPPAPTDELYQDKICAELKGGKENLTPLA
jgi:hypothetical protein